MNLKQLLKAVRKGNLKDIRGNVPEKYLGRIGLESCKYGQIEIFKYICSIGEYSLTKSDWNAFIEKAIKFGHINICKYIQKNYYVPDAYNKYSVGVAIKAGRTKLIKTLDHTKINMYSAITDAATYNRSYIFKYLVNLHNGISDTHYKEYTDYFLAAAKGNSIEILRFISSKYIIEQ